MFQLINHLWHWITHKEFISPQNKTKSINHCHKQDDNELNVRRYQKKKWRKLEIWASYPQFPSRF